MSSNDTTNGFDDGENSWSPKDLLRIMYLVFGLLGVVGNGLVIFVFLRVRSLMNITNLFIGNQSMIDLFSSVFLLITKYGDENSDQGKASRGVGKVACLFWSSDYVFWALLAASTTNLVFLTLERYIALVLPVTYRNRVNWNSAKIAAAFAWVFGFLLQLYWPAVHQWTETSCYPNWRSPLIQALLGVIIFLVKHLIPILVMVFVYVGIVVRLRNKVSPVLSGGGESKSVNSQIRERVGFPGEKGLDGDGRGEREGERLEESGRGKGGNKLEVPAQQIRSKGSEKKQSELQHRVRRNVIKTLLLVGVTFTVCWTPNQVTFLCYNLGIYKLDFNGTVYVLGVLLAFCNIWINPFIYTFKYRKFQQGLRKVFSLKSPTDHFTGSSTTRKD